MAASKLKSAETILRSFLRIPLLLIEVTRSAHEVNYVKWRSMKQLSVKTAARNKYCNIFPLKFQTKFHYFSLVKNNKVLIALCNVTVRVINGFQVTCPIIRTCSRHTLNDLFKSAFNYTNFTYS
jgi:hypothetical protein